MVFKKKLPLAVVISMSTMLMMHVFMPLNLHANEGELEDPTNQQKRSVNMHELEACPEEGDLLPEETPYWSDKIEEYKKPKYEFEYVGEKPLSICCAPDNTTKKSFGYIEPPKFTDKSKNPCWYDGKRLRCMPYFFIIGASKSATTDLFKRLLMHPDVKCTRKEIHWFSRLRTLGAGLKWYTSQFNTLAKDINTQIKAGEPTTSVIGEVSIDYLSDVQVWPHLTGNQGCYEPRVTIASHVRFVDPKAKIIINLRDPIRRSAVESQVHRLNPSCKILLSLRNPLTRLYSKYLFTAKSSELFKNPSPEQFHEYVVKSIRLYTKCFQQYSVRTCAYNSTIARRSKIMIHEGLYVTFLEDWLRIFPRKQMYVVRMEDYSPNIPGELSKIYNFLDLAPLSKPQLNEIGEINIVNAGKNYDVGPMMNKSMYMLKTFYKPFNERLARLLKEDKWTWNDQP
ncbi:carbohydrate sulfotransferase 15-like [Littorina saxatilis]|uniref:carbohydrate sulfotransferase 15-like n=1 Tax=Littorina saxatilis TaxID=31220 RepID=UPI0038B4354F